MTALIRIEPYIPIGVPLCFCAVWMLSGCSSSLTARTSVTSSQQSVDSVDVLNVKEEKLVPEARFLYDLTYQKSILSTCNQKKYSYKSAYGKWYQYSDCKFKFYDVGNYETSLNVHVGGKGDSINAVSYMEFPSTKSGQNLLQIYGDGVISTKEKYCSVYGIGGHFTVKLVKPGLCQALTYKQV